MAFLAGLPLAAAAASPPAFDVYSASPPAVRPGETVAFAVDAHDPDCGPLSTTCSSGCGQIVRSDLTRWTVSGGTVTATSNGTAGSPYHATMTWRAPATPGSFTVTVSLSDNGGTFGCSGTTRLTDTRTLAIQVSDPPNMPPVIGSAEATPDTLFVGESATLSCTASDPEGGAISYTWTTDFGTVTPYGEGRATFTAAAPGLASITCRANDPDGGTTTALVRVAATGAAAERRVVGALASPHRVAVGSLGELYVADPDAGTVVAFHLGNGAPSHRFPFPAVTAIATDWQGRVLVGLRDGKAAALDRSGRLLRSFPDAGEVGEVSDIAVDSERQRIAVLHRPTGRILLYDASLEPVASFGSTGDAAASFLSPSGVAFTPDGRIAIADSGHGQIKLFDASGSNLLLTFGGTGSALGKFTALDDVAVDADGLFYASDPFQSRIQVFNPDGTAREALGSWGDQLGRLKTPTGLAVAFDRLVVASTNTPSLEVFRLDAAAATVPLPRYESVTLSPSALEFGELPLGAPSAARIVTLNNAGGVPVGLVGVRVEGDFAVARSCSAALDPGVACRFEVTFAPALAGRREGRLALETSDGVIRTVALAGVGTVGADALLSPSALDVGAQRIGTLGDAHQVLLINPGTAPLALSRIAVTGDFALTHACPPVLAPSGFCSLAVRFAPGGPGLRRGAITVDSSSPRGPTTAMLAGSGVGMAIGFDRGALDFGATRVGEVSAVQFAELFNLGAETLVVDSLSLAGERSASFLLVDNRCDGVTLEPGVGCRFALAFQPGDDGPATARLDARTVGATAAAALPLAGEGEGAIQIEIPTLSEWGLLLFALLVAAAGIAALRGRIAG